MSLIRVTPQMLMDSSRTVAGKAGEIDQTLATLAGHIRGMTADWQGQAQVQFEALYDQWQQSAANLQSALTGISELLNAAGIAYEQSESDITRMFAVN